MFERDSMRIFHGTQKNDCSRWRVRQLLSGALEERDGSFRPEGSRAAGSAADN